MGTASDQLELWQLFDANFNARWWGDDTSLTTNRISCSIKAILGALEPNLSQMTSFVKAKS